MHRSNRLAENQSSLSSKTKFHSHNTNHNYSGHTHGDAQSAHPHVHSEESLRSIVNRLSRIEGHIGVLKQWYRRAPVLMCWSAVAVRGALDRVARMILDEHLTECIARAAEEGNIDVEIKELKAALDRFLP